MPTRTGELVALAAKGDKNALAELYTTNFKSAYFPACGLLNNKQDALRTVIGCFAKAFENLSKLPKPDEFEDFIKQITVKKCIDIIKKRKGISLLQERPEVCRNEIGTGFEFLPIEVLNSKELTSAVMKTVNSMPDTQRICVYLCYYNGYSASATAKLVSCTEDDVKWHLLAAREQIKNAVDSKLGKPTELSRMNGTSILSLVMELMKKELTVNSETVKKSFFMACEKSGIFGAPPQKKAAPVPVSAYATSPSYPESAYEQPAFVPEIPQVQRERNKHAVQAEQKKSGGKTAIIIAAIAVLMIVAGVFAYWLVTKDDPDSLFAPKETTTVSDGNMIIGSMMTGAETTYYFPSDSNQGMIIGSMQTQASTEKSTEVTENETTQPETTQAETTTTQPRTEPTTAKKADDYMAAYNEFLKNYNGGVYENGFYFGFGYFNNDNIPELFVSHSGAHYSPVHIFTFRNGDVITLGDYGVYGALYYVERESLVVTGNVHMGYESGSIIKVCDDGTNEVLFQHLDNRAAVVPDSGEEVFFEINGERVSEEEYNKAVEENMSIETISYYEGIRMTKENIDKHCK